MPIDSDNIHKHLSKISRINFVLAVLSFVGVAALYGWFRWGADRSNPQNANTQASNVNATAQQNSNRTANTNTATNAPVATQEDIEKLTQAYQQEINSALKDFDFHDSTKAGELLNRALGMYVPASLRQMHIQVVVALQAAQQGEYDQANERITQLSTQYPWFLP
jgi:hypothetical protein